MFEKRNKIVKKLVIIAVVFTFFLSAIQLNAQNIKKTEIKAKQITITKSDMKLERQTIRTTAEKRSFKQFSNKQNIALGTDSEVLVTNDYTGHPAVVENGFGNAVCFIEMQDPDDFLTREIVVVPSYNSGSTWDLDVAGIFPNDGGYNKLPALDFRSGMTAYGSWISEDYPAMTCIALLEDMSDPFGGEYGWVYWSPDWLENDLNCGPMYSTDVACYDGPLNEEPDAFWGIVSWNGAMDDPENDATFDHGIFMNYFSEEYIFVSWFPSIEGAYNIQSDIDQSNGMIYWIYELYNPDTKVNDLAVMYQTMEGWFDDESFPYWLIDGPCSNPAIMAENGILCVAFESEGDIICVYSSDNADSLEFSYLTDSEDIEKYPDITGTGLSAACAFNKNNDIYVAITEDGGVNWVLKEDKLNDVDRSLADEYHCINLLPNRVFWTDTRNGVEDVYSDALGVVPNTPTISGRDSGKPNKEYDFIVTATHPENGQIWYWVDWGDGNNTGWDGPYNSGNSKTFSHTWSTKDNFIIKAKAKSSDGTESAWAEHPFSTPKNKGFAFLDIYEFLNQRFSFFEKILNQIV